MIDADVQIQIRARARHKNHPARFHPICEEETRRIVARTEEEPRPHDR